jgi:ribosomal protein S12 methylthiotransferase accessory factor
MSLRFRSTKDTLVLISKYIKQAGITRLADLSYLDDSSNLNVFSAIRPNAKSITTSMGKSIFKDDAQCAALMESIETYFAEEVKPVIKNITQRELREQHNLFIDLNKQGYGANVSNNQKIDWCFGKTLVADQVIYIPHVAVSLDSTMLISKIIGQNSDGIASGANFKEALIYSFLELIERHSTKTKIKIQLENIESELFGLLNIRNIDYVFYLYRNMFNIPVIECNILNSNPLDNQAILAGYSCHFSKYEAVNKAFIEAIQSKVGIISGARDDLDESCYKFRKISELTQLSERQYFENIVSFDLSLNEQYDQIIKLLKLYSKDLAIFTYLNADITILKTFMVNNE